MTRKRKIIIIASAVGIVILLVILNFIEVEFFSFRYLNPIKRVYIKNTVVRAEIVSSEEKIEQGLAGRKSLDQGTGMLFMMPADNIQHFWMQGMQFPIDIIWIEKGRVIGCERGIAPNDSNIYASPGFSSMVLEVNKGFCEENNISVNDTVKIQ
jgi:uncharacterized membrane protein (UPF0127 family)